MNLERAYEAIDQFNENDPVSVWYDNRAWPSELLYGIRMTEELEGFMPDAPMSVKVAVRAQHIGRWTSPRSNYPMDRAGYLRWRSELYGIHADLAADQLRKVGFEESFIAEVSAAIRDKVKRNTPAAQTVEDVACLVFLRWYFDEFMVKQEREKLIAIVRKTWGKMSDAAHDRALTIPFPPDQHELIQEALSAL